MENIKKTTVAVALTTLVIGLLFGWLLFGRTAKTDAIEHDHLSMESPETIWTCSMHPQIRSNESGSCPICGMDLIPLENENDLEINPMAVSMSPTAMKLANVSTVIVSKKSAFKSMRLNGKVQVNEGLAYLQSSHISGRIEKLLVNNIGEYVTKDEPIAYVYSPELVTAQEELFEANKIKESQPALYHAARAKLKNWKLTDNKIDQIISSGEAMETFPIHADVSGFLTEKNVNLGDYIKGGQSLYKLVDLSSVWVLLDLYESDLAWVKTGNSVSFTVSALPGKQFKGKITYIDPVVHPTTRVVKARLEATNKDLLLKPEMFFSGILEAQAAGNSEALIIPKSAVLWTGVRSVVYVKEQTENGINFLLRQVTLGPTLGDSYIIEAGLKPGEEIAVKGTFSIDAAAQLAGKPSMMSPDGGPAMTGHNHAANSASTPPTKSTIRENEQQKTAINSKEALTELFTDYLKFKDALVEDDFEGAQQAATLVQKDLDNIDMSLFSGKQHQIWMDLSKESKLAIEHVAHFENIAELREAFQLLSQAMREMANSFKPLDEVLYVQFCPMADGNKGASWLSLSREIKNPYFGSSMLGCGEVTEELD